MFVFLISITLLYLSFSAPTPAPDDMLAADNTDTLDEPDLEIPDLFEFLRTNLTNQDFDLHDFFVMNDKYSNFTKKYKNKSMNTVKNTRKRNWQDPEDEYAGEMIEELKKQQFRAILVQFTMHCRYEVAKALTHRELVRHDKRYKLGYLFNRMRRLKTDQLKMVAFAWTLDRTDTPALMRLYEYVVYLDVDMRDTANLIKDVYNQSAPYDSYILTKQQEQEIAQAN